MMAGVSLVVVLALQGATVSLNVASSTGSVDDAPPLAVQVAGYVVGPDDVLAVTVFNEPQLSGRYQVDAAGTFAYPLLGQIPAAGLSVERIANHLKAQLADGYLRSPQLSVEVAQFRSQSVFIMGEVRSPGRYMLPGAVTLIEALAQAGSTTADAAYEVLVLHPRQPDGRAATSPADGDVDVQRVSLRDLQQGRLSENVAIRDGDTILVPEAERFFVTGHVRNPGSYVLERGMTVLQALSLAGGLTERGSSRRIEIIRLVGGEKKEIDVAESDLVKPGDTIRVRQRLL